MHVAGILLLLVVPVAGLAAPIEKHSTPYQIFSPSTFPLDSSPICYRRWRHHGHLTFRLARLHSRGGVCNQHNSPDNANIHYQNTKAKSRPAGSKTIAAKHWVG